MEDFYYICAAVLFGIAGVCIGSFSNVVIYRLPRGMSLVRPPSHCPQCGHELSWRDNIPLLSFLFLRGRCRYCGAPISPRYFFVELLGGLLYLVCFFRFYASSPFVAGVNCLALSVLVIVAFCDEENLLLPDSLHVALLVLAYAELAVCPERTAERLIGAAVGGGFYLIFYLGSLAVLRREGLGFGDVKLASALGLLLGWKRMLPAILLASLFSLLRLPLGGRRELFGTDKEYPLAPSIAAAGGAMLLFGEELLGLLSGLFW